MTDAILTVPLDSDFIALAEGERPAFRGTILPAGENEVWGGYLSLRTSMFAEDNGKTVVSLWQHNPNAVLGTATLSVGRGITLEGRPLDTPEGEALAERISGLLADGANLEMSMGVNFDGETFRKTKGKEKGEYTYDKASIVEASVVLSGEVKGTRFRMAEGYEHPKLDDLAGAADAPLDNPQPKPHTGGITPKLARALGRPAAAAQGA